MAQLEQGPYDSITFGNSLLLRVDGAIGAMSLSPNGRDAVLAGRRGLFIIDLDDPFSTPRWLHHITSWEVADVQWSPHHSAKPSWCVSTSNQKALLWDLARPSDNAIVNVLHEHTRAITDINFKPSDPEILATCSIDTFVFSWDMRTPRRPVARWAEWRAGATQVKWNHKNPHEIASSHDDSFYLWDWRKGALPVLKVNRAHEGKINGLDFSNGISNLITCSNDKTIKCWNLNTQEGVDHSHDFNYFAGDNENNIRPSVVVNTDYSIARARSLPFGKSKACGIMPLSGGQDSIHIIDYDSAYEASIATGKTQEIMAEDIYTFKGHNGAMKDFLWRTRHEKYEGFESKHKWKDYQLVTWSSRDYDLKLWPHDEELYKKVNYNPSYQKLLNVFNDELEPDDSPKVQSPSGESFDDDNKKAFYNYQTYFMEPDMTFDDLGRNNTGDMLSSLASFQIARNHKHSGRSSQMNHLDWISGVRMGRTFDDNDINNTTIDGDTGPSNLGEEVTIVGHKFPKVRFEKISVSTGQLKISLKGPAPYITSEKSNTANPDKVEDQANEIPKGDKVTVKEEKSSISEPTITEENNSALNTSQRNSNSNNNTTSANNNNIDNTNNKSNSGTTDTNTSNISTNKTNHNPTNSANTIEIDNLDNQLSNNMNNTTLPTNDDNNQDQKLIFIRIEINFPKSYPFLEEMDTSLNNPPKKIANLQKMNLIRFNIEETHELTSALKNEMLKFLNEIAQFYTNKYKKFCLEPCLRYLMGDKIDLLDSLMVESNETNSNDNINDSESLIQEVGTEGWADDLINQQPDFDFRSPGIEEDKFEFADFIPAVDDDDLINSTGSLRNNNRHELQDRNGYKLNTTDQDSKDDSNVPNKNFLDSTPVPKGCGAMWSHTGQLVCFFIPKNNEEDENKPLQKFNIFKFTDGGFSLDNHSPRHQHKDNRRRSTSESSSLISHINSDTNYSDGYVSNLEKSISDGDNDSMSITSSSSEDSFSNDLDEILQDDSTRLRIPGLLKTSVGLGNRYISHGNNKGSLNKFTSHGTTSNYKSSVPGETDNLSQKKKRNRTNKKNKNIVGIFDFSHLIPDKYELACEYRVLGDSPEKLARYNSEVALKYGLKDLSDIWRILEIVLVKDIEFDSIRPAYGSFPDANKFDHILQESQIGKDLLVNRKHRFYWGMHPFGRTWLIKEIMKYFEKKGNIQMLAMLSCILFENSHNVQYPDLFNIPIHTPYKTLPPPPSIVAMRKFNDHTQINFPSYSQEPKDSSAYELYGTDSKMDMKSPAYQTRFGNSLVLLLKKDTQLVYGNKYSRSISSSFGTVSSRDLISDKFSSYKKNIPYNNTSFSNELCHPNDLSKDSYLITSPKTQLSRSGPVQTVKKQNNIPMLQKKQIQKYPGRSKVKSSPFITIEMQNTESLDLFEDEYTLLLLDSQEENKIKMYREQYADMLYIWKLPINRIKILKFNYLGFSNTKNVTSESQFDAHRCKFGLRKIKPSQRQSKTDTTIQTCGTNSWNTKKKDKLKYCNLCNTIVKKRLVVCTNCEHVLHAHCAVEWWSNDDPDNATFECPSGCGCKCLDHRI